MIGRSLIVCCPFDGIVLCGRRSGNFSRTVSLFFSLRMRAVDFFGENWYKKVLSLHVNADKFCEFFPNFFAKRRMTLTKT